VDPVLVQIILFLGISLTLVALFLLVRDLLFRGSRRVEERLRNGREAPAPLPPLDLEAVLGEEGARETSGWMGRLVGESGTGVTPPAALMLAVASGLLVGGVLFLWRENLLVGAVGALAGMILVLGFFWVRRSRRRAAIRNQLPEMVDFLAHAVRAGESLDQAMGTVGRTESGPLASEFRRCAKQLEMGLSFETALRTLVRRAPLTETRIFAAALLVQRRTGGNLPTTLERLAAVFRERLSYYRHFRASTAAARGSVMLISCIGIGGVAYAVLGQPEYMQGLLHEPLGRMMLAGAIALQIIGITWASWLLRSEY
jgi:tight adherence protein B